ncbi:NADase-type glycan-binding domain-containing protein [Streptomyces sp. NBC_01089]|uniref:NADase-type glycan-binding domain-containing protein n=1 Tax=Streptomyces sp. NBC_01089 TaxID=2903747 RepID=UPI003862F178|nr:zinc ribbon domain-containing protein [Streptomyces sp. NBC_01089]
MTTQPPGADPGRTRERTRTCAECGTPSTPGHSFCEGCGAVLSWSPAERAAAPADPPPPAAEDDDEPSTLPTPVVRDGGRRPQDAPGTSDAQDRAPAAPAPDRGDQDRSNQAPGFGAPDYPAPYTAPDATPGYAASSGAAPAGGGPDVPAPRPGGATPGWDAPPAQDSEADRAAAAAAAADRARALLVPVADPERRNPDAPSVAPVLPGRPETSRPLVQGPAAEPDGAGGYACPWCATGNRPDRHFCRRCGMSMAERPEGPARLPWWRRLRAGNREVPWAGDRPRLRSGFGWIVRWLAAAAALGLVIWGALNTGAAVQAIGDHFAKRAAINVDDPKASRSFADHTAGKVFDGLNNTYWEPGRSQDGRGEWVQATFQDPVRLLNIIITPGISVQPQDLSKTARPHRIDAIVTQASGKQVVQHLNLDQGAGPQTFDFRVGTVSSVRFVLRTGYGISDKKQVAIAEVEFFGRSHSS